jgi:hypothetical protein
LTNLSCIVEGQFPITISYNLRYNSKLRITFGNMALKSLDGVEVWNTANRKRKLNMVTFNAGDAETRPTKICRSVFLCDDL